MTKRRVIPLSIKFLYVAVFIAAVTAFAYMMYQKHKHSDPLPATPLLDPAKVRGKYDPVEVPKK